MTIIKTNPNKISVLIEVLRPHHWIKNTFIYAPLIFSGQFKHISMCLRATLAFICFCLVSSAIYIINDLYDINEDRQHPTKKYRPIASSKINPIGAFAFSMLFSPTY